MLVNRVLLAAILVVTSIALFPDSALKTVGTALASTVNNKRCYLFSNSYPTPCGCDPAVLADWCSDVLPEADHEWLNAQPDMIYLPGCMEETGEHCADEPGQHSCGDAIYACNVNCDGSTGEESWPSEVTCTPTDKTDGCKNKPPFGCEWRDPE